MKQYEEMTFFVYVDSTLDGRPFYVGKGNAGRVRQRERNVVHKRITSKHGWQREIVFASSVEQLVLDVEIQLIAELKTQMGLPEHWGANLTAGGEGLSNPSPEIRRRMSMSQRARRPDTPTTRDKKRASAVRLNADPAVRQHKSHQLRGHIKSEETCIKLSRVKRKPVDQLDLQDNLLASFSSALEAEQVTGVSRSKICLVCKGIRPHAGGYHWRYGTSDFDR
jgi:hypothetical protein